MSSEDFGLTEQQAGWRVHGNMSLEQILKLSYQLIEFVGMTPDGQAIVDRYPKGGKGGKGWQVYQPLFESWLIISTWPAFNFVRVNLSSCKAFDPSAVGAYLAGEVGPILQEWSSPL